MRADYRACLDANVLANQNVCDLLLRLAETPRLYTPIFSQAILDEVWGVHTQRLRRPWPTELADYWQSEVKRGFPECLVSNFDQLIPILTNHKNDRHVLAAAIAGQAELILTFNTRHFPFEAVLPWGIEVKRPDAYLIQLYEMAPDVMMSRLHDIAASRQLPVAEVLRRFSVSIPEFFDVVAEHMGVSR